ncbi:MAG: hypothetical protein ACR2GY_03670 [Phycisphaerales bacterium]
MKKLIKIGIVLVFLVIAGLVAGYIYIDQIATAAIRKGGAYALGVETDVRSVNVDLIAGSLNVNGLTVANPGGFGDEKFLAVDESALEVKLTSLRDDVVRVPRFTLDDVEVQLIKRDGKSNYEPILESLKRFEAKDPEDAKRFIVNEVAIRNVVVHLDLMPELGSAAKIDLPIDEILLKDIGSESDRGVVLAELTDIIVKAILQVVVDKAGNLLPASVLGELQGQLAQLEDLSSLGIEMTSNVTAEIDKLREGLDEAIKEGLGGALEGAGDEIRDIGEGLGDGLGDGLGRLLNRDKKKDDE